MALIDILMRELNTATLSGVRPLEWRMTRLAYRELRRLKAIDTPRPDGARRRAFLGIPIRLAPGMGERDAHLHFRALR